MDCFISDKLASTDHPLGFDIVIKGYKASGYTVNLLRFTFFTGQYYTENYIKFTDVI